MFYLFFVRAFISKLFERQLRFSFKQASIFLDEICIVVPMKTNFSQGTFFTLSSRKFNVSLLAIRCKISITS